jgi:TRAP-type mannitol/chloroaromatic compound transport system substrate-binding protein
VIENESETEDGAMGRIDSQLLALTQESVKIMQDYESEIAESKAKKDEALKPIIEKKNKFLAQKAEYLRLRRQMKDLENNMKDV